MNVTGRNTGRYAQSAAFAAGSRALAANFGLGVFDDEKIRVKRVELA